MNGFCTCHLSTALAFSSCNCVTILSNPRNTTETHSFVGVVDTTLTCHVHGVNQVIRLQYANKPTYLLIRYCRYLAHTSHLHCRGREDNGGADSQPHIRLPTENRNMANFAQLTRVKTAILN